MPETGYWDKTDRFEEKLKLLETAWARRDYRLARALTASLRNTVLQQEQEHTPDETPLAPIPAHGRVEDLPAAWREWARGWRRFLVIHLDETTGQARPPEPVEVALRFPIGETVDLSREIRLARVDNGALVETACQVHGEVARRDYRACRLLFLAASPAHTRSTWLVFYGNPDAELPDYPSDLRATGEGFALDVENDFFRASLSRQMGQLERLTFKREHGLELFAGGEGHGEPPGIDWAHDYVSSGNFQKLRITLWDTCPDYEVIRGPVATIVRRWGFPYSPVHPVFSPSRVHMFVEYRFYAGLPWFHKTGRIDVIRDVEADAMRDDEWVFSGQSFTDSVWMGPDGKLRTGAVDKALADQLWGVGFVNKTAGDAFLALFLEHRGENLPELRHSGAPLMFYKWHGHVWSRYPLPLKTTVPAGAVLHQRNAYVAMHYREDGAAMVEALRHRLTNPLAASAGELPRGVAARSGPGRLARPGEAGDAPVAKQALWEALRECKDEQLYRADISVVELGLIRDIRVRGDVVTVVMQMPHRGRPRLGYFEYGSGGNSMPVRQRLMRVAGVRKVVVEQTWEPAWSSNRLTSEGRRKLGMEERAGG
ncbi:MAG: metal-sulfur cluster assembly factor [Bryobacteraceae bacterium]